MSKQIIESTLAGLVIGTAWVLIVITGLVAMPTARAGKATNITLSGRVYNTTTGQGYKGVTIYLCAAGSVVTTANGNWTKIVPTGTSYCARVSGGVPAGLVGPTTNNLPAHANAVSYEYQQAGYACYGSKLSNCSASQRQWDRGTDSGIDFRYITQQKPIVTPMPTPRPIVPPAPAPLATTNPSPGRTSAVVTSAARANQPVSAASTPTPAASVAPSAPTGLRAVIRPDGRVVQISWDPAASAVFVLERSADAQTWQQLSSQSGTSYGDSGAQANMHYYYRLSVVKSGQTSAYATAEVLTPPSTSASPAAVTATTSHSASPGPMLPILKYTAITVAAGGALAGLAFVPLPLYRRQNFHEYLRAKYYNF